MTSIVVAKFKKVALIPSLINNAVTRFKTLFSLLKALSSIEVIKDENGNVGIVVPSKLFIAGKDGELHLVCNSNLAISTTHDNKLLFNSVENGETVDDAVRRIKAHEENYQSAININTHQQIECIHHEQNS